jgi:hypothetical protein
VKVLDVLLWAAMSLRWVAMGIDEALKSFRELLRCYGEVDVKLRCAAMLDGTHDVTEDVADCRAKQGEDDDNDDSD